MSYGADPSLRDGEGKFRSIPSIEKTIPTFSINI